MTHLPHHARARTPRARRHRARRRARARARPRAAAAAGRRRPAHARRPRRAAHRRGRRSRSSSRRMIDAPFAETLSVRWRPIGERGVAATSVVRALVGRRLVREPAGGVLARHRVLHPRRRSAPAPRSRTSRRSARRTSCASMPTLDDRLEALDRARLAAGMNEISLDVDRATTSATATTSTIASCAPSSCTRTASCASCITSAFGFGSIQGRTPLEVDARRRRHR